MDPVVCVQVSRPPGVHSSLDMEDALGLTDDLKAERLLQQLLDRAVSRRINRKKKNSVGPRTTLKRLQRQWVRNRRQFLSNCRRLRSNRHRSTANCRRPSTHPRLSRKTY